MKRNSFLEVLLSRNVRNLLLLLSCVFGAISTIIAIWGLSDLEGIQPISFTGQYFFITILLITIRFGLGFYMVKANILNKYLGSICYWMRLLQLLNVVLVVSGGYLFVSRFITNDAVCVLLAFVPETISLLFLCINNMNTRLLDALEIINKEC